MNCICPNCQAQFNLFNAQIIKHYSERKISPERIMLMVSEHFSIDLQDLTKRTRQRHIVEARQIAMWLMKKYTSLKLRTIADKVGGLHHATVLHGMEAIEGLMLTDLDIRSNVAILDELCKEYALTPVKLQKTA